MKRYFFDAHPAEDEVSYPTGWDRNYHAADHAEFMRQFANNGVFGHIDPDACKVTATGNILRFVPGAVFAEGNMCVLQEGDTVEVSGASGYYTVVCRLNRSGDVRDFELLLLFSSSATSPTPVRAGDIYDIFLARCTFNGVSVTAVVDLRPDASVCGFAHLPNPEFLTNQKREMLGMPLASSPDDAIGALIPRHGTCSTAAATAAKTVSLSPSGVFKLFTGVTVSIRFSVANVAAAPTLNVDGTGAKPLFNAETSTYIKSHEMVNNMVCDLVYNGASWLILNPVSAKIQRLSYTGTGVSGAANPNTLTFPFLPQIVHIREIDGFGRGISALVQGTTNTLVDGTVYRLIVTWSGNNVSWYLAGSADHQLNTAGRSYAVVAIG